MEGERFAKRCTTCDSQRHRCTCPDGGTWVPEPAKADKVAHPTVKPLDLMRWLVRLVTPPGGVVLDPFAGSGTTVEAALLEGFRCIAIEREAEYLPLIEQRLERQQPAPTPLPKKPSAADALALFDFEEPA